MKKALIFLSVIMLSACSSKPVSMHYYLLDQSTQAYQQLDAQPVKGKTITLSPVKLAKYLQQAQLVILKNSHQLYYSNQNVWAEPLSYGVSRALINQVNSSSEHQLKLASEPHGQSSDYQLQLQIDHLVATENSQAILAGKFWLLKKGQLITNQPFYYEIDLTADGFAHAVGQQRQLINKLAQKIIEAVPNQ